MGDDKKAGRDDFWDIAKLVPPAAKRIKPYGGATLAPLSVEGAPPPSNEEGCLHMPAPTDAETFVYRPEDNPLLLSVRVTFMKTGYSFYEQFRRDAVRYAAVEGEAAPYVPFFSFTPQYHQLTEEQLAYYFYFRSEVKAGRFPPADKGYFFLLVYEIINLTEKIPPAEGSHLLARLWSGYRTSLGGIDRYMRVWLADYCLLHRIPVPALTHDCFAYVAGEEESELFFGGTNTDSDEGVLRLLHLSSDYAYESSRALTEGNRPLMEKHIVGAMRRVLAHLFKMGEIGRQEEKSRLCRRAFSGSLCAQNVRAELEITYFSLRRTEGFRRTVGLAVKYAENHLRALIGIRARLSAGALPLPLKAIIDAYFAEVKHALAPSSPPPAYMHLYEAVDKGFSAATASAIEGASWALTRRLIPEEFGGEDEPLAAVQVPPVPDREEATEGAVLSALIESFLCGGDAPRSAAARFGLPLALAAERVNEHFLSVLGDVVLLATEDGFSLIEDYREDTEQWLKTNKK